MKRFLIYFIFLSCATPKVVRQTNIPFLSLSVHSFIDSEGKIIDPILLLNKNGTAGSICACTFPHKTDGFWREIANSTYLVILYESTWISYNGVGKIDSSFVINNVLTDSNTNSATYILKKKEEKWLLYDEHSTKVIAVYKLM